MRRIALAAGVLCLAGCGTSGSSPIQHVVVTSSAFGPSGEIPREFTCDGRNISPPLHWSEVPDEATQLMLTMKDPGAPGGSFIHWQMSALSPRSEGLGAGQTPAIGIEGTNGFGTTGYRGPCPPRGSKPHHYVITVNALAGDRIVGSGTLTGTYSRG